MLNYYRQQFELIYSCTLVLDMKNIEYLADTDNIGTGNIGRTLQS